MEWPKLATGQAYCIDWLDHYEEPGEQAWHDVGTMKPEPCHQRTVGMLVKETKELVTLAHTFDQDSQQSSAPLHILKSTVVGVRKLSLPRRVK